MSNVRISLPTLASFAIASTLLITLPTATASAQARKNVLDGQPAVRHRLLLVKSRFEAALAFEGSLNADYRHTLSAGLKLEYHLTDMWSIGAVGLFGTSFNTGLSDKIVGDLPDDDPPGDPTPTAEQFEEHLNNMPVHGAAYVSVTPWYGKLAAFGKFFVNFDFYFQGGVAVAQLTNDCCTFEIDTHPGKIQGSELPDNDPNDDPALNEGTQIGLYLGGGIHLFLSDWIALDLTVRDYLFADNPSGLDFDADLAVTKDDNRFLNHLFMGVGVSFFLPGTAKRTR